MAQHYEERFGSVQLATENSIPGEAEAEAEPYWHSYVIDETRWDKSYPFQLLFLKHEGGGRYSRMGGGTFTLPIPPQALSISTPFAIATSVTLGGIVEEHNGAPLRMITMQGTTGVLPGRGTGKIVESFNAAESIFAGTVRATENFQKAVAPLTSDSGFAPNNVTDEDLQSTLKGTTGYYQFLLLKQFLEAYVNMKKRSAGREFRLGFAQWKTQDVYLVTPLDFTVQQSVASPLEYNYSLVFKAWRRISLEQGEIVTNKAEPITRKPGALQQLNTKLDDARRALAKLNDVISAVGQDINAVLFEPMRSVSLFVKDLLGIPVSCADLPVNIVRDMKAAILEAAGISASVNDVGNAFSGLGSRLDGEFQDINKKLAQFSVSSGKAETAGGQRGSALTASNPDPANKILENPQDYYEFFEKVKPGSLNLAPATSRKIIQERERVRKLTRLDFETMRDTLVALLADFSDLVGAGSSTYSRIYGRAAPTTTKVPTQDDFDVIFALNAAIMEMNRLAASGAIGDQNKLDVLSYVAGLAGRSGINFKIPASKRQVPFPYGSTLEQLSARYLGDPDRWHEIAVLNRLREPYVDEVGFDLDLLVNGSGNKVVVDDAEDLYVGQPVWLSSSATSRSKRRITAIDKVSAGNVVLTLDGDPDLDRFTTMANASLHAYLPDTVNSQMLIFIPDDRLPSQEDFQGKSIPGLDEFANLLQVGGVDLLLTPSGDAAITPNGDWRYAVGMQNLVQRARTFVTTPKGSMIRHPKYGLGIQAGQSTADISAQELLASMRDLFIFDPVFTGIRAASVIKNGPTTSIGVSLQIAGSDQLLPLTVDVKR